ncbi:hypothetical protein B0T18DRAFT_405232 [Schizothecium vesticola]|uniref:Uncharacterized protein n=1 Tax=Schizothecium vesticola TaxID=314040 RepID=A0AA40F7V8_9PEZI|nr:hypothetical protein B0T18DRAFT_405232 [Schizothecium vesticola]
MDRTRWNLDAAVDLLTFVAWCGTEAKNGVDDGNWSLSWLAVREQMEISAYVESLDGYGAQVVTQKESTWGKGIGCIHHERPIYTGNC